MLSSDTLSQLTALKQEIRASKDIAPGVVRGTAGRYGFVRLDDNRDVYLSPAQMEQVLPGDRVDVAVTQNQKEQLEGTLEALLESPIKQITGRYCIKGKGHFVIYENQLYTRWIFVPPKARAHAQDQQYVTATITQHPFKHAGKAQAKITHKLSDTPNANDIRHLSIAQHQLLDNFSKEVMAQTQTLQKTERHVAARRDLRALDFITIDAASTRDMDDAITVTPTAEGWQLWVAIADPSAEIAANSPLDRTAARRMQSLYFPGKVLPMLPEALSTDRYSLLAKETRLALACKLTISREGAISDYEFIPALIQSAAKLSYQQASELIAQGSCEDHDEDNLLNHQATQLQELHHCTQALHQHRQRAQLVLSSRPDFYLKLNPQGKVESVEKAERTQAHIIVEEAMIATNQSAGDFLARHHTGLFSVHPGYKEERRTDIEQLLKEALGETHVGDTRVLNTYIDIIKQLQNDQRHQALLYKQQRFHDNSQLSLTPAPHFGLGTQHYATITSPIRRYQDLYNQRLIHQVLQDSKDTSVALQAENIRTMQATLSNNRQAVRYMHQWLIADYMADKVGQTFSAYIALLTTQGVGIRLVDTGIEGFVARRKADKKNPDAAQDKISFNHQRLELRWNTTELALEQTVEVTLSAIDPTTKKLAFRWAVEI
ncbi:MAG: VacB/RNase II family 3'-5' exoribonuclease [Cellvibrionaceae bacterium]|nr:VacB/RNase II family 3'-5' exoribonuclease [Cellvibrionaceae bacterium]